MILGVTWSACEAQLKLIAEHSQKIEPSTSPAHETLMAFGLVDDAGLTPLGEAYHFARYVLQDSNERNRVLAEMLKAIPEVNALCDSLWGRGDVPFRLNYPFRFCEDYEPWPLGACYVSNDFGLIRSG